MLTQFLAGARVGARSQGALVRSIAIREAALAAGVLLCVACDGRVEDAPAPEGSPVSSSEASHEDEPPVGEPPPSAEASTPASPPACRDRSLRRLCGARGICSYETIEQDTEIQRFLSPDPRCLELPEPVLDAGLDGGADAAPVAPACRQRSVEDLTCRCTNAATGAVYTRFQTDGDFSGLSLYFTPGDAGPGELVGAVEWTDLCDECGCATYYGERIDCACDVGPEFGAY